MTIDTIQRVLAMRERRPTLLVGLVVGATALLLVGTLRAEPLRHRPTGVVPCTIVCLNPFLSLVEYNMCGECK